MPASFDEVIFAPTGSTIRAELGGAIVAQSRAVRLLRYSSARLVYGFPETAIDAERLERSQAVRHDERMGRQEFLHLRSDARLAENAVYRFPDPPEGMPDTRGFLFIDFAAMDGWYEEDEPLFGNHPRDPYTRIDVRSSRLEIQVVIDGTTVAHSPAPLLLFETGLPVRYYIPHTEVRFEHLVASSTETVCCYKGRARYWHIRTATGEHRDLAWAYPEPLPDAEPVRDAICFQQSRLSIYVNGTLEKRAPVFFAR